MERKITLKSSDGEVFEVDVAVAMESQTIKHVIEVVRVVCCIPLFNVNSRILAKVVQYCKKHVDAAAKPADDGHKVVDEELENWDAEFVKVDLDTLDGLILAANYLNIKGLLDLTCQAKADWMMRMTPEEMGKFFNLKNVLTPEEQEEVRRESPWALGEKMHWWHIEEEMRWWAIEEMHWWAIEEEMREVEMRWWAIEEEMCEEYQWEHEIW